MTARLVTIGDSLTQGFQSGSISRTEHSYPMITARAMGIANAFRVPDFSGAGGLPVNLEELCRQLYDRFHKRIRFGEVIRALLLTRSHLDEIEDYWERGDGTKPSGTGPLHNNLAVWGFEVGDSFTLSDSVCRGFIPKPKDNLLQQIPECAMYRTAIRTLNPGAQNAYAGFTQMDVAHEIARVEGGIDYLIFALGANNCLGTVTDLEIRWSEEADLYRFAHQRKANLWTPLHFRQAYEEAMKRVAAIRAETVIVGTVPHVTIPPVSRGVSMDDSSPRDTEGYYEFYVHCWVWDRDFRRHPDHYTKLTRVETRLIDQTIDRYNEIIAELAEQYLKGRHILFDVCGLLDSLAFRRSGGHPKRKFPAGLVKAMKKHSAAKERIGKDGAPILDTRYLRIREQESTPEEKFRGGLFSLDGIHPTTIFYGIVADQLLKIIKSTEKLPPGSKIDWDAVVAADSLITDAPRNVTSLRNTLAFLSSHGPLPALLRTIAGGRLN